MQPRVFGFGKLRLENNGRSVTSFPTRQVEELFGYLVLHPGVHHPREKIINLLWPNYPTQSARSRMSTVLWRLKHVLQELDLPPDEYLQVSRDSIALNRQADLQSDVREFSRLMVAAGSTREDAALQSALTAALALYKGDLYEGLYADWCLLEREHFYRLHLRALGQLMACLMRNENYEQAVELGEEILRLDPLREEVHRALMRCYWKLGRHASAAGQFERCVALLQAELGIGPMPETVALYTAIVEERVVRIDQAARARTGDVEWTRALRDFREVLHRFNALLERIEKAE